MSDINKIMSVEERFLSLNSILHHCTVPIIMVQLKHYINMTSYDNDKNKPLMFIL